MYRSKFDLFYVYISVLIAFFLLIVSIYFLLHPQIKLDSTTSKHPPVLLISFIFFLFTAAIVYPLFKRAALLFITGNEIRLKYIFQTVVFDRSQIASIQLTARKTRSIFDADNTIMGIKIILNSGQIYFLPDKYFSDIHVLKQKLETFCNCQPGKIKLIEPAKTGVKSCIPVGNKETFSGSYLLSSNCLILISVCIFFAVLIFSTKNSPHINEVLFVTGFLLFFCSIFSVSANYFLVSPNTLTIKNHLFFWKKKTYEIGSIKEIYFVGKYHSSNSMQIVFRNYRSKEFLAGSLREKNWLALKNRLESEGVPVENDFYLSL